MSRTKILIVDDHRVVVEGIRSAFETQQDFEVVGEAFDGIQAIELMESLRPDIIIMDISMPSLNGIQATKKIKEIAPDVAIVIFTMHSGREYVVDLFKEGISAYVLKEDLLADLILAIRAVRQGGTYFSTRAPEVLLEHIEILEKRSEREDPFERLSHREYEVFCLLAEGVSVKGIAQKLFLSPKTVESHKYNILAKLGAKTLADLTKMAIRKNLISP